MSFQEKRETMSDTDFTVPEVRTVPVPVETIVMELGTQRRLLVFKGLMPLPVGTRIQLGTFTDPPIQDAVVQGIRVWDAGSGRPALVLDVKLVGTDGSLT